MFLDIEKQDVLANHLLLQQGPEKCKEITETEQFKNNKELELKILINGTEIEYEEKFEEILQRQYRRLKEHFEEEYNAEAFDRRVKEQAEAIIKNKMSELVDKLDEMSNNLSNMNYAVDQFIDNVFKDEE